jgi:hypothetical protein
VSPDRPRGGGGFVGSTRDAILVARWWLARALRTRSAVAVLSVYVLTIAGGTWVFTRILLEMERAAARALMVPMTDKPGAMLDTLRERGELMSVLEGLIGDAEQAAWALDLPILSSYAFWLGLAVVPFLAAAAGAETIAPDIRDRSLRFELVRTGRLELILGRFAGQALLVAVGLLCGFAGVWVLAMVAMVEQPPVEQATSLLMFMPRLWVWSLPWLGLGVACSQLTGTVNFARTMALGGVAFGLIGYALLKHELAPRLPWLGDLLLPVMPPTWLRGLWGPGWPWLTSAAALAGLAIVAALVTYPLFRRRNA